MLPYILALVAALLFGVGAVVQQRVAFDAPAGTSLRLSLLWWLVRQPAWLAGVGTAILGNLCAAAALGMAGVALVQPLLVTRLLFAVPLSAVLARQHLAARDWLGALATAGGLATFVVVARPGDPSKAPVDTERWVLAAIALIAVTVAAFVAGRALRPTLAAPVLGGAAGALFGMQSALTYSAVDAFGEGGVIKMLETPMTYGVAVTAIVATLLAQSAYEMAPLTASYPALAAVEPLVGVLIGVLVLGSMLAPGAAPLAGGAVGLGVMTLGVALLATSKLVTSQRTAIEMRAEEDAVARVERQLEHRLTSLERAAVGPDVARLEPNVERLAAEVHRLVHELDQLHEEFRASCREDAARPGDGRHRQALEQGYRDLQAREAQVRERLAALAGRDDRLAQRLPHLD